MTSSKSSSIVLRGLRCTMTDEYLVIPSQVFVNNAGLVKYCVPLTCTVERSWLQCLGILYLANALDTLVGSHANFRVGDCTDFKQVVKAIWQKGCMDGSVVFARWQQCAHHLIMLPRAHPSPQPKRKLCRLSHFHTAQCRVLSGMSFPKNCGFTWGDLYPM